MILNCPWVTLKSSQRTAISNVFSVERTRPNTLTFSFHILHTWYLLCLGKETRKWFKYPRASQHICWKVHLISKTGRIAEYVVIGKQAAHSWVWTRCWRLGIKGGKSTLAVTKVTAQPLLQLSNFRLTEVSQHKTHFRLPRTLLTVTYNNACDDLGLRNTD